MLHLEMNVFTRRKKLEGISVCWVFTKKEKSQSISVHSTKTENNCTTKNVHWNHTDPDFKTNWFAIWIFDTTDGFKLPSSDTGICNIPTPVRMTQWSPRLNHQTLWFKSRSNSFNFQASISRVDRKTARRTFKTKWTYVLMMHSFKA